MSHTDSHRLTDTHTYTHSPQISALLIVSLCVFAFSVTAIQSSLSSSIEPCARGGAGWKVMGKNGTQSRGGGGRGERDTVCRCHRGCIRVCIRKMGRAGGVTKQSLAQMGRAYMCVCVCRAMKRGCHLLLFRIERPITPTQLFGIQKCPPLFFLPLSFLLVLPFLPS